MTKRKKPYFKYGYEVIKPPKDTVENRRVFILDSIPHHLTPMQENEFENGRRKQALKE